MSRNEGGDDDNGSGHLVEDDAGFQTMKTMKMVKKVVMLMTLKMVMNVTTTVVIMLIVM